MNEWITKIFTMICPIINHIIIVWSAITIVILFFTLRDAKNILESKDNFKDNKSKKILKSNVSTDYIVFVAFISLFPCWGMLGTVASLISIDFSSKDNESIKSSFFTALSSTGLGLLGSIIFKVINAKYQYYIEKAINVFENRNQVTKNEKTND